MGNPEWTTDASLSNAEARWEQRRELDKQIAEWTASQERYHLMERLQAANVPAGAVQTGQDLTQSDPQLKHSKMHFPYSDEHPTLGPLKGDRLVPRFSKTPPTAYHRPEVFGESNATALGDWLNWTPEETATAETDGLIT